MNAMLCEMLINEQNERSVEIEGTRNQLSILQFYEVIVYRTVRAWVLHCDDEC